MSYNIQQKSTFFKFTIVLSSRLFKKMNFINLIGSFISIVERNIYKQIINLKVIPHPELEPEFYPDLEPGLYYWYGNIDDYRITINFADYEESKLEKI